MLKVREPKKNELTFVHLEKGVPNYEFTVEGYAWGKQNWKPPKDAVITLVHTRHSHDKQYLYYWSIESAGSVQYVAQYGPKP